MHSMLLGSRNFLDAVVIEDNFISLLLARDGEGGFGSEA